MVAKAKSDSAEHPLSLIKDVSEVIPDSVLLSSALEQWQGIKLMQVRQDVGNEFLAPAISSHLILINLGTPAELMGKIDGQTYERLVAPGEITLIPAGYPSEWRWKNNPPNHLHLYLTPKFIDQTAVSIGINPKKIELSAKFSVPDSRIEHTGLALKAELKTNSASRLFGDSLAVGMATHLLSNYAETKLKFKPNTGGMSGHRLRRAIEFINDNLSKNPSLQIIAKESGISPYHFAHSFKESVGMPVHQYLIFQRIERSKQLLADKCLNLAQISESLGFANQSHFIKHFRRLIGTTPKTYRDHI